MRLGRDSGGQFLSLDAPGARLECPPGQRARVVDQQLQQFDLRLQVNARRPQLQAKRDLVQVMLNTRLDPRALQQLLRVHAATWTGSGSPWKRSASMFQSPPS